MDDIKVFKEPNDPGQIQILEIIKNKENYICYKIPKIVKSQSNVSLNLRILKKVNIIKPRKEGTIIISSANTQIYDVIDKIRRIC